ncbi:MAG: hypothetical protein NTW86_24320 [Candidatus Sumerlaeota bacterium]|nr:hypothetical protein [Candidatus Sumerlaeota bacterium]
MGIDERRQLRRQEAPMRHPIWFGLIAVLAILALCLDILAVHAFFAHRDWRYYVEDPSLLWKVGAFAVLAGLGAFVYDRLSCSAQYRVRLLFWGAFALAFTYPFIELFSFCPSLSWSLLRDPVFLLVLIVIGFMAAMFWGLCWLEVRRRRQASSATAPPLHPAQTRPPTAL